MNNTEIHLIHLPSLDSTNRFALDTESTEHLLTVVADTQTGGKGRLGRSFFSPGSGLYMSVILDPQKIRCTLPLCTPAAAVAVREALYNAGIEGIQIKWVNDLLLNGKKVCGILTEAQSSGGQINKIVVGIGINLLEPDGGFPEDIRSKAGAVNYTGNKLELAKDIAHRLDKYIASDSSAVCEEYKSHLAFLNCFTTVTDYADNNKKVSGTISGVDDNCFLKIKTADGTERLISSGEII